jgi:hypothetical protein
MTRKHDPVPFEEQDKIRLRKVLGMLGSSFDAERLAATFRLDEMTKKHGLTLNELIALAHKGPQPEAPKPTRPEPTPPPQQRGGVADILGGLRSAQHSAACLTEWELQFVIDVPLRYDSDYELSERQIAVADRILAKVERWRAPR